MSLLDVLNNKKDSLKNSTSFTQQAEQMKSALTGRESGQPAVQKSNVAEQITATGAVAAEKQVLGAAQATQKQADTQTAQIAQQQRLQSIDYQQKESELTAQAQRNFNTIYTKLSESYLDLDEASKEEQLEQLKFFHNLADRKYVDLIQLEGDRRRLDNDVQMKTALLYSTFDDQIDQLNSDVEFKRALAADERGWQEYLATIDPQAALEAALIKYKSEQAEKATIGMAKGVSDAAGSFAASYHTKKPTNTEGE